MIIAETLKRLIAYTPEALTKMIRDAGYKDDKFTSCRFLGITNGGQFCYMCVFHVEGGTDSAKVFVTYNHAQGTVEADY